MPEDSERETVTEELKDVDLRDTRSRRSWETMLATVLVLGAGYGLYQLLHRTAGFTLRPVERWKARRGEVR